MDEIRKNQNVKIELSNENHLEGFVFDYSFDRVLIEILKDDIEIAKTISELDNVVVTADTHLGLKKMNSTVISSLDENNRILIENNPAYEIKTNREFSRIKAEIPFVLYKDNKKHNLKTINVSGNGIAFNFQNLDLKVGDEFEIELKLPDDDIIETKATTVKVQNNLAALTFKDINEFLQNKIVKFVFNETAKSNNWR